MVSTLKKIISNLRYIKGIYRLNIGECPICQSKTLFVAVAPWLRDNYRCVRCFSIPRQRAIVKIINEYVTAGCQIHESSPSGAASKYFERYFPCYSSSQYFPKISAGEFVDGIRCENLERMSFEDESFDLFVTQDVLEHVFDPAAAFSEVGRVLKPGGYHIFTVPCDFSRKGTDYRAVIENDEVINLKSPEYHKNPVSDKGSLVTVDYGRDLPFLIDMWCGMKTTVYLETNKKFGLEAKYLEVFVSQKQ